MSAPQPYLPPELYNDLQEFLLHDDITVRANGRTSLLLANRLMNATGASALRRRELDQPEDREGLRTLLVCALGEVEGLAPWEDPTSSDYGWMMEILEKRADAVLAVLTLKGPTDE